MVIKIVESLTSSVSLCRIITYCRYYDAVPQGVHEEARNFSFLQEDFFSCGFPQGALWLCMNPTYGAIDPRGGNVNKCSGIKRGVRFTFNATE